jgi:hypothetical protein
MGGRGGPSSPDEEPGESPGAGEPPAAAGETPGGLAGIVERLRGLLRRGG